MNSRGNSCFWACVQNRGWLYLTTGKKFLSPLSPRLLLFYSATFVLYLLPPVIHSITETPGLQMPASHLFVPSQRQRDREERKETQRRRNGGNWYPTLHGGDCDFQDIKEIYLKKNKKCVASCTSTNRRPKIESRRRCCSSTRLVCVWQLRMWGCTWLFSLKT